MAVPAAGNTSRSSALNMDNERVHSTFWGLLTSIKTCWTWLPAQVGAERVGAEPGTWLKVTQAGMRVRVQDREPAGCHF